MPILVPADEAEYVVVDVETTDLSPERGRVIEVAAAVVSNGEVREVFATLVNPGEGVSPGRTDIHRITREELDQAPSFTDVVGGLTNALRGRVVVAHNASFDLSFLQAEFERAGLTWPDVTPMCTLRGSRKYLRDLPNHRLGTVCEYLGVTLEGWHAAEADVRAAAAVLTRLLSIAGDVKVPTTPAAEWPTVPETGRVLVRAS